MTNHSVIAEEDPGMDEADNITESDMSFESINQIHTYLEDVEFELDVPQISNNVDFTAISNSDSIASCGNESNAYSSIPESRRESLHIGPHSSRLDGMNAESIDSFPTGQNKIPSRDQNGFVQGIETGHETQQDALLLVPDGLESCENSSDCSQFGVEYSNGSLASEGIGSDGQVSSSSTESLLSLFTNTSTSEAKSTLWRPLERFYSLYGTAEKGNNPEILYPEYTNGLSRTAKSKRLGSHRRNERVVSGSIPKENRKRFSTMELRSPTCVSGISRSTEVIKTPNRDILVNALRSSKTHGAKEEGREVLNTNFGSQSKRKNPQQILPVCLTANEAKVLKRKKHPCAQPPRKAIRVVQAKVVEVPKAGSAGSAGSAARSRLSERSIENIVFGSGSNILQNKRANNRSKHETMEKSKSFKRAKYPLRPEHEAQRIDSLALKAMHEEDEYIECITDAWKSSKNTLGALGSAEFSSEFREEEDRASMYDFGVPSFDIGDTQSGMSQEEWLQTSQSLKNVALDLSTSCFPLSSPTSTGSSSDPFDSSVLPPTTIPSDVLNRSPELNVAIDDYQLPQTNVKAMYNDILDTFKGLKRPASQLSFSPRYAVVDLCAFGALGIGIPVKKQRVEYVVTKRKRVTPYTCPRCGQKKQKHLCKFPPNVLSVGTQIPKFTKDGQQKYTCSVPSYRYYESGKVLACRARDIITAKGAS